jgi:hypothetical protein
MLDESTMTGKMEMLASVAANEPENRYIVTVKLKKNPEHNPHSKITGLCPLSNDKCTDVTGEHHSELYYGTSAEEVTETYINAGFHVTRVEQT